MTNPKVPTTNLSEVDTPAGCIRVAFVSAKPGDPIETQFAVHVPREWTKRQIEQHAATLFQRSPPLPYRFVKEIHVWSNAEAELAEARELLRGVLTSGVRVPLISRINQFLQRGGG